MSTPTLLDFHQWFDIRAKVLETLEPTYDRSNDNECSSSTTAQIPCLSYLCSTALCLQMIPVGICFHERKTSKGQKSQVMLHLFEQLPLENQLPLHNPMPTTQLWSVPPHISPHSTPKRPQCHLKKSFHYDTHPGNELAGSC